MTIYDIIGLVGFAGYGLYVMVKLVWNQGKHAAWERGQAALFQAYKQRYGGIDNEQ